MSTLMIGSGKRRKRKQRKYKKESNQQAEGGADKGKKIKIKSNNKR
jgi:hypothetical protein